jgi:hypothetical protein
VEESDRIELVDWRCPDCGESAARFIAPRSEPLRWPLDSVAVPVARVGRPEIECRRGHRVPVDGVIISSDRAVDYGSLTPPIELHNEDIGQVVPVDFDAVSQILAPPP